MGKINNILNKTVGLLLGGFFIFNLAACKQNNPDENNSSNSGVEETPLEQSGYELISDGYTEYTIVLPENPLSGETMAAAELQYFFYRSTGIEVPIVSEGAIQSANRIISIGNNRWATAQSIIGQTSWGESGYMMKTIDNSLYIVSNPKSYGNGCTYGAYQLLEDTIGWKSYAADEIVYSQETAIPLFEYDMYDQGDIDVRAMNYQSVIDNTTYASRMRLYRQSDNMWGGVSMHAQVKYILTPEKYGDHKDWYASASQDQLCWSAGAEMERAFANEVFEIVKNYPQARYIRMGQEDMAGLCNCSKCLEGVQKYGNIAGVQIVWANRVIDMVEEMVKAEFPDRTDLLYIVYAYHSTEAAPAYKDENGDWKPYHQDAVPHEKLGIYYAPIGTDYSYTMQTPQNESVLLNLEGWGALTDNLLMYGYNTNYLHVFNNFNNFGIIQNHYQAYAKNNAIYLGELGQMRTITPCFEEMRIFCQAQIAWDTSLRYDDLVTEFMDVYYQEAAGAMRKYYEFTRTWMSTYEHSKQVSLGGIYADLDNAALWPKGAVDQLDKHINEALIAIEAIKETDVERYQKLYNRIKKESLTPTYLKLLHYSAYYSSGEAKAMKEEFRYYTKLFGITKLTEAQELDVDGLFPDI